MKLNRLGLSGLKVSELCLGTMNFGNPAFGVDEATSLGILDRYLDAGGNFVDTADAYAGGASEEILGKGIGDRRERVILATKGYFARVKNFGEPPEHPNAIGCSRRHLTMALEASLKRLKTDYVDLYQVHCWDPQTPLEETLSTLDSFVKSGKVRYVGLSNYSAWQIAEARQLARFQNWEPFVTAQMQYSLICRSIEQDVVPACERYGMGILAWSPLGQGVLTGKYRQGEKTPDGTRFAGEPANAAAASWRANYLNDKSFEILKAVTEVARKTDSTTTAVSLAWLLNQTSVSSVIIGPKTNTQLDQNLAASDLHLPADAIETLEGVSRPTPRYPEWFIDRSPRVND
jgi:aryl-alcohol dehydrogenase-like predicted oxidoreductase